MSLFIFKILVLKSEMHTIHGIFSGIRKYIQQLCETELTALNQATKSETVKILKTHLLKKKKKNSFRNDYNEITPLI